MKEHEEYARLGLGETLCLGALMATFSLYIRTQSLIMLIRDCNELVHLKVIVILRFRFCDSTVFMFI